MGYFRAPENVPSGGSGYRPFAQRAFRSPFGNLRMFVLSETFGESSSRKPRRLGYFRVPENIPSGPSECVRSPKGLSGRPLETFGRSCCRKPSGARPVGNLRGSTVWEPSRVLPCPGRDPFGLFRMRNAHPKGFPIALWKPSDARPVGNLRTFTRSETFGAAGGCPNRESTSASPPCKVSCQASFQRSRVPLVPPRYSAAFFR